MSEPASATEPRALVVGATGFVGRAVVAELRRIDVACLAHVRFDSPRLAHWREHFAALGAGVDAAPWTATGFDELLSRWRPTLVFLCLGTTQRRKWGKSSSSVPDTYAAVDLGLSILVIEALVRAGLTPRVVLLSAAGAKAAARSSYLSTRGRLEDALIASGLEYTIARPGFISGPGRDSFRPLERLGAVLTDSALLWGAVLGMQILRERYRSIGAPELAKALVAHALDPHGARRVMLGERLRDFP